MHKAADLAKSVTKDRDAWRHITHVRTQSVIEQAKQELNSQHPEKIASGIAPYIEVPTGSLPPQRRADFLAHIRSIVEKSFQNTPIDEPPPEPPSTDPEYKQRQSDEAPEHFILNTACIACQGDCCMQGNASRAFLTENTINYVRWCQPEMEQDEIIEMYMSFMPERSIQGSCVYHGDEGCTLDRHIRADICNSFQCGYRKKLAEDYAQKPGHGAVVAGISQDHTEHPNAGAAFLRVISMSEQGEVRVHSDLKLPSLKQSHRE
jgi:hypothetical protein